MRLISSMGAEAASGARVYTEGDGDGDGDGG